MDGQIGKVRNAMPRYSIITPTLVRPTLKRLCDSIDAQTNQSWEHIIMVDVPLVFDKNKSNIVESMSNDPRRKFFRCGQPHKNYGNTCRWNAFDKASGDYIIYLDDDDYLADDKVFETLEQVTKLWAIFPIMRCGNLWFCDPPGMCKTGSGMFIYRRFLGLKYPDNDHYCADGELCEQLKAFPYQSLGHERPLMIYEQRGLGRE
jgi:glycosyltransferase involved in cell wall biosynthesis